MAEKIDFKSVSYVLGILSIVFAFISPMAGLILGIIGLVQAKKQKAQRAKRLNIIGIILSVIFLIISAVVLVYSVASGINTFFPSI